MYRSEDQLTAAEQQTLEQWIKTGGFGLDPAQPDPGRVTVRHLNRTEYRNTLRDLIGVDELWPQTPRIDGQIGRAHV